MTLDEVKQHLRVEGSEDDALITSEMAAAESCQQLCHSLRW